MTISNAMQEYLAETYRLTQYQSADSYVSTSALADVMGVSAPAVTRMVQRLKTAGYLEHEPYRGIRLTPSGQYEALMNIRKHRIVERFLTDVMQFGWHEVHDSADDLGSTVSDTVVSRMEAMADFPRRCPHGEPIPNREGLMPEVIDYALPDVETGKNYVVSRANSHDEEKLKYLSSLGIKIGISLKLIDRAPFHGPLQVEIDGQQHFIGYELAGILRVCSEAEFALV